MNRLATYLRYIAKGKSGAAAELLRPPVFDQRFYTDISEARLDHLQSLHLDLQGRSVIDIGSGIGRLAEFFVSCGCDVLCVDGREDNIRRLRELYPNRRAKVLDVEEQDLLDLGTFNIVFCYGLLYHLADPLRLIKQARAICTEMLLLETCLCDSNDPILRLVREDPDDASQALHALGCRPSAAYVQECLKLSGFGWVYVPRRLPFHEQFQYDRLNDLTHVRHGKLMRGIFIASHEPLKNANLVSV